jgi:hypothetical protein
VIRVLLADDQALLRYVSEKGLVRPGHRDGG